MNRFLTKNITFTITYFLWISVQEYEYTISYNLSLIEVRF